MGISLFHIVYGTEAFFPSQPAFPVAKLFQDCQEELDDMIRRIRELVEAQQTREKVMDKAYDHQQKIM
jgi:hypothetical protein